MTSQSPHSNPPLQARSRDTERRIIEALRTLLKKKPLEDIAVAEIARAAGVSVGGFYARFPGKEALLLHLCDEGFVTDMLRVVDERLDAARWVGASAGEVVQGYIDMAVREFRRHKPVLQQVALNTRTSPDQAFRERVNRFNRIAHDSFRALLMARRDQMAARDIRTAVDLGLIFVSAAMREVILFGHTRPDFVAIDDDRLIDELTIAYCAYLQTPPPKSSGAKPARRKTSRGSRRTRSATTRARRSPKEKKK